ncbi:MAG: glucose-6-phosphate dehydrogenase assembly protein OpcA [Propionibacteriaceae bacterium]|nr:glucose-6-phosphate dehydrogenase assembly protein OpcA [Propionibacteriaceae bacterium]
MITTLKDTTSAQIQNAITKARQSVGAASGMVFTLLAIPAADEYDDVFDACVEAGREHPSRIIIATDGSTRTERLDAELHIGDEIPGEVIALKFHGELMHHKTSAMLPLLLPDSPVIAWWPSAAPVSVSEDRIGQLAVRRITDAMGCADPLATLLARAEHLAPGDTDLTWTRLTPWRAMLASALDHHQGTVLSGRVTAAENNAAGLLMAAWLRSRLHVPVEFDADGGPGVTGVTLTTAEGDISVQRPDGKMAEFTAPRTPPRSIALRRRDISALLTEELRRLDTDAVFLESMAWLASDVRPEGATP